MVHFGRHTFYHLQSLLSPRFLNPLSMGPFIQGSGRGLHGIFCGRSSYGFCPNSERLLCRARALILNMLSR
jgi:hypothetical protein